MSTLVKLTTAIDTKRVSSHRKLRFESIDDALDEMDRLVHAQHAARLECMGNWTLGQILNHLATWVEFGFSGVPIPAPPLPIRLFLKLRKKAFLTRGMPMGVKIPKVEGGTLGTEPIEIEEAARKYRTAMETLRKQCPQKPNIIFGPLTHQEWINLNLRHAELHLGFARERSRE